MRILPILFNTEMVRGILEKRKSATRRVIHGVDPAWAFLDMEKNPSVTKVGKDGDEYPKEIKGYFATFESGDGPIQFPLIKAPYEPGDILYVRETWTKLYYVDPDGYTHYDQPMYYYAADGTPDIILRDGDGFEEDDQRIRWRPSIHMPKEAARIFLKVKSVRAERLQDSFFTPISPIFELLAEGMDIGDDCRQCIATYGTPCCVDAVDEDGSNLYGGDCGILDEVRGEYSDLWDRLYAKPMPVKEHGKVVRYESYPWEDIQEVRTYRGLPWLVIGNPWVWVIEFERTDKPEGWPGVVLV